MFAWLNEVLAKLRELWIIPIFFVVTTVISMSVAFLLGWTFRLKRSQRCVSMLPQSHLCLTSLRRSFAIAAAMFMNSNSLPIALMQSLVVTVPGLKWGDDDSKNAMVGRALTYLVLYSTLGMVVGIFGLRSVIKLHSSTRLPCIGPMELWRQASFSGRPRDCSSPRSWRAREPAPRHGRDGVPSVDG